MQNLDSLLSHLIPYEIMIQLSRFKDSTSRDFLMAKLLEIISFLSS